MTIQTAGEISGRPAAGDISFAASAVILLKARRTLGWLALVGALVGVAIGLLRDRVYVSRVIFLPKGSDESASGLALAASQFGLALPGRTADWWPAIYVEVLSSPALLGPIVTDTFTVAEEGGRRASLLDLLKVRGTTPEIRAARGVKALGRKVAATEDKKLGAVRISVSTRWPSVSQALAERLVEGVNQFNIETRRTLAAAEREFVDAQAEEAARELRQAEDELQAFLNRNRTLVAPDLVFQRDRMQRTVGIRTQAYTNLLQSREQARIREVRNTPVISMIEGPRLPVLPESRGVILLGALGLVTGLLVGALWVFATRQLRAARATPDPNVSELVIELQEMVPRLLRRWVGL
jgi:tyrosine-protein kinase Etk/Wzc